VTKSCTLDRVDVRADDENRVSDAGPLVPATLGQRLGLPGLLLEHVTVPGTVSANPDQKCLIMLDSLLAGDCIDDVDALRPGATQAVLGASGRGAVDGQVVPACLRVQPRPSTRRGSPPAAGQGGGRRRAPRHRRHCPRPAAPRPIQ